jgi:hypothetical protein
MLEKFDALSHIVAMSITAKNKVEEKASSIHSRVRETFFKCMQVPFESELLLFKRFQLPFDGAAVLLNEVVRYISVMRNRYLEGKIDECKYVQQEITSKFWENTKSCLVYQEKYEIKRERKYSFSVDNADMDVTINGVTDRVIKLKNCGFVSVTLEDKPICLTMAEKEVSQVVTQVKFEVKQLENEMNFAPEEYVGLLQNGHVWIAVLRKISQGKVLWSYVATSPAFEVSSSSAANQPRTASAINMESCVEIARLIEHAYCTADSISEKILNPEKRKQSTLSVLKEFRDRNNDDDDDDGDDNNDEYQDAANGDSYDFGVSSKVERTAVTVPAENARSQKEQVMKNATTTMEVKNNCVAGIGNTDSSQSHEYFLLPLTIANISLHGHTTAPVC